MHETSVDFVCERQNKVVSESQAILSSGLNRVTELDEILQPLGSQTRLVQLEYAKSIAVYFICLTLSAATGLRDHWRNGQLRHVFESLFTFFSGSAQKIRIEMLTWPLADYEHTLEFFSVAKGIYEFYLSIGASACLDLVIII